MFICKIQLHKPVILTRYNWSTVENRKDLRIQACLSVCVCVGMSVRYGISQEPLDGSFWNFWMMLGVKNIRIITRSFFENFLVFSKTAHLLQKKHFFIFLAVYGKTDPVICLKFWQNVEGIDSYDFKWLDWDNSYFLIKCMNLWHFFVTKKNVLVFFGILPLQCLKFW